MAKRPAAADAAAAKKPKTGDDPLEVREQVIASGNLITPTSSGPQCWTLVAPGEGQFEGAEPVELMYFCIRGLGVRSQLCLEVAGYPYVCKVMTSPYFRENVKTTLPFGMMPLLRTPKGTEVVQSNAVLRYVAKLCKLSGKDDEDAARCDMLYEMLQTEGKLDAKALPEALANLAELGEVKPMKEVSRREHLGLSVAMKCALALKFWESTLASSSSGWLLGSLPEGSCDHCFVDLVLYWDLQEHLAQLKAAGFKCLAAFVEKAADLPGMKRFLASGRLMPKNDDTYNYVPDSLVSW